MTEIQVNIIEIFGPLELIHKVINQWDWIPILDNDLIQRPIVNIESPGVVFILYQHDHAPTW